MSGFVFVDSVFNEVCKDLVKRRDAANAEWKREAMSKLYTTYLEGEDTGFIAKLERAWTANLFDEVIDSYVFRDRLQYLADMIVAV